MSTYEDFFERVVNPYLDELRSLDPNEKYIVIRPNRRDKVYNYYEKKRVFIRDNYMEQQNSLALDRHKVASCMTYAILKSRII